MRESRSLGSVGAKAEWLSYPTIPMVPGWSIIASEVLKNCPDASVMNTRPVLGGALFNPHRFRQPEFLQHLT